jgi:hypothetical protein
MAFASQWHEDEQRCASCWYVPSVEEERRGLPERRRAYVASLGPLADEALAADLGSAHINEGIRAKVRVLVRALQDLAAVEAIAQQRGLDAEDKAVLLVNLINLVYSARLRLRHAEEVRKWWVLNNTRRPPAPEQTPEQTRRKKPKAMAPRNPGAFSRHAREVKKRMAKGASRKDAIADYVDKLREEAELSPRRGNEKLPTESGLERAFDRWKEYFDHA